MKDPRIKALVQQREHFNKYYDRCPEICWPTLAKIQKRIDFLSK